MAKKVVKKKLSKVSKEDYELKLDKSKVMNIISVVLGGLSILFVLSLFLFHTFGIAPYLSAVAGILGVIFAYAYKDSKHKKLNRWGFILSLIGIFLAIVVLVLSVISFYYFLKSGGNISNLAAA